MEKLEENLAKLKEVLDEIQSMKLAENHSIYGLMYKSPILPSAIKHIRRAVADIENKLSSYNKYVAIIRLYRAFNDYKEYRVSKRTYEEVWAVANSILEKASKEYVRISVDIALPQ